MFGFQNELINRSPDFGILSSFVTMAICIEVSVSYGLHCGALGSDDTMSYHFTAFLCLLFGLALFLAFQESCKEERKGSKHPGKDIIVASISGIALGLMCGCVVFVLFFMY